MGSRTTVEQPDLQAIGGSAECVRPGSLLFRNFAQIPSSGVYCN